MNKYAVLGAVIIVGAIAVGAIVIGMPGPDIEEDSTSWQGTYAVGDFVTYNITGRFDPFVGTFTVTNVSSTAVTVQFTVDGVVRNEYEVPLNASFALQRTPDLNNEPSEWSASFQGNISIDTAWGPLVCQHYQIDTTDSSSLGYELWVFKGVVVQAQREDSLGWEVYQLIDTNLKELPQR